MKLKGESFERSLQESKAKVTDLEADFDKIVGEFRTLFEDAKKKFSKEFSPCLINRNPSSSDFRGTIKIWVSTNFFTTYNYWSIEIRNKTRDSWINEHSSQNK